MTPTLGVRLAIAIRGWIRLVLDRDQFLAAIPFSEQGRATSILDEVLADRSP